MEPRTNTSVTPEFRLVLPAAAVNVAVVRQALGGALGMLGLEETRMLDINAAVSEACNNVVVHAYPDADGPMEVRLWIGKAGLEVIVSDKGVGIRPNRPTNQLELQGLGLSLIQTLTEWVEFLGGAGDGTKVRMGFSMDGGPSEPEVHERPADAKEVDPPPGELIVAVSAGPLAAPVLGRVISMLGARAGFSLEGVSEAQLVTDSLAAHAPAVTLGDKIQLGIDSPDAKLLVRVGPLEDGGAERVVDSSALGDLPPVLDRLTSDRRVESYEGGELLCLSLVSPR
jgi:anti-sigma regulatory factor (Ser/Thr protein kinase)